MLKRWLHKRMEKTNEDPALNNANLVSREPGRLSSTNSRSRSRSPTRVNAVNEGPPRMAAGKRQRRTVWRPPTKPRVRRPSNVFTVTHHTSQREQPTNAVPPMDASSSTQGAADSGQDGATQQADDGSAPSIGSVRITRHLGSGKTSVALTLPDWMLCFRSSAH
ncbi:hypothetical protein HD554DRAFT_1309383 [Boletus coccyginus]|nr:hypothetical protein HD554DRAFT_1309383 [Boletus coccyginus]